MKSIVKSLDVIILSLAKDEASFNTTKKCVDSYLATAEAFINNIFVVETDTTSNFKNYGHHKVQVIVPNEKFNYNKFFNIALQKCTAEFVMGPNNDLIIEENCVENMLLEFRFNPTVSSISPIDRNWHRHTKMYFPDDNKLYYGWETSLHVFGCIICARR